MVKFIIFSPSYDSNVGGVIVLHKLCHLLNELGYQAELYPAFSTVDKSIISSSWGMVKIFIKSIFNKYKTNINFQTPIFNFVFNKINDDCIVIYPEVVNGNPLRAKNVVRWLLHNPGFHTGKVNYAKGELYFKFNSAIKDFYFPGSIMSNNELEIIDYPLQYYNNLNNDINRSGTAYCLRKGKDKEIVHDIENSILIDGKSHAEIANIFRSVNTFISYDTLTAYSFFAVLCGAESVVVPDKGVCVKEWYPNEVYRHGISYGFSKKEMVKAKKTKHLALDRIVNEEFRAMKKVKGFAKEAAVYFKLN